MSATSVSAPYRFVPLSSLVVLPDWAEQVSHDMPFEDGVCGQLEVTLAAVSPICVGGEQTAASEKAPGRVHFARDPNGRPMIPGSSLKGMLRNVLEIASFGRLRTVEDQRLGVRDISQSDNFYSREMVRSPSLAGWLRFEAGRWSIRPCRKARIHQSELIRALGLSVDDWKRKKTGSERRVLFEQHDHEACPAIHFDFVIGKEADVSPDSAGTQVGRIVVTGQPGKTFDGGKGAKQREFVFYEAAENTSLVVPPEVMAGFQRIHEDSGEWKDWRSRLQRSPATEIPVFYHLVTGQSDQVASLGLAMMYKLPYRNSIHDAIRHTHAMHLDESPPDLPDLVFGHLPSDDREVSGLRGRVNAGPAHCESDAEGRDSGYQWFGPTVLSGPKPTFYPFYVRQDSDGAWRQLMESDSEIAGWKRYPVRGTDRVEVPPPPEKSKPTVQVELETLPAGTTFTFPLRVHNLRFVELGALLWILDFGDGGVHGLGVGKPFGLGQVRLSVTDSRLCRNDGAGIEDPQEFLAGCRQLFCQFMEDAFSRFGAGSWSGSGPIRALQDFASPNGSAAAMNALASLDGPKMFMALRRQAHLPEVRAVMHSYEPVRPGADADPGSRCSTSGRIEDCIESVRQLAAEAQAAKAAAAERIARREAANTEESRLILAAEEALEALAQGQNKTRLKALQSALRALDQARVRATMSAEEVQQLSALIEACGPYRSDKQVNKFCERLAGRE